MKTHEKNAVMSTRSKNTSIREIQILGYEKPTRFSRRMPDFGIGPTGQSLDWNRVDIVAELRQHIDQGRRQILVKLDSHVTVGTPGVGKSS